MKKMQIYSVYLNANKWKQFNIYTMFLYKDHKFIFKCFRKQSIIDIFQTDWKNIY